MTIKRDDDVVPIISAWEFLALEEKLALDALAYKIADQSAVELVISEGVPVTVDGARWYELDPDLSDELRYCDCRGLLEHHPTRSCLVQIVERP